MSVAAEGRRVALREFRADDVPPIDVWYQEAVQVAYGGIPHPRPLSRAPERGERSGDWTIEEDRALVVELVVEPEPIGMVEYDVGDGWLTVRFIALAKAYRGWGYGSEAVRLLEDEAIRKEIAQRFRAEVDVRNGLGLYFWLRLGYRPEAGSAGVLPMVRELR
jgi:RimJ/RimL family protein N-acetyltransferase